MENLIKKNHMMWAVSLFILMFAAFIYFKPSVSFGPNGSIKPFGVKKRGSTIFPVWFWTAIFAAISRISVSVMSGHSL
jgi:quinol-cytochrome oxidoreductase complex cytochrome b subunit